MKSLFTTILICTLTHFYGQIVDSTLINLNKELNKTKNTTQKIDLLLEVAEKQYDRNFNFSKQLVAEATKLLKNPKDSTNEYQLAKTYVIQGIIYRREADYTKAIELYLKAKTIYDKYNDVWNSSDIVHNMAMVYRYQKEHRKAILRYKTSISIKRTLKDVHGMAASYNMMGVSYRSLKKLDSAEWCYNKARSLFKSINSTEDVQRVANNMVALFLNKKEYKKALNSVLRNINYAKENKKDYSLCIAYKNASNVFKKIKEYKTSMLYADSSLQISKKKNFKDLTAKAWLRKSFLSAKLNDYKNAYEQYRVFNRHSDSIFNIENIKNIQRLELNYKFNQEKREVENLVKSEAFNKRLYLILFLVSIISTVIIVFLVFNNHKIKTKALQGKLEKEKLEKELLHEKMKHSEAASKHLIADNTMRIAFKEELINKLKEGVDRDTKNEIQEKINSLIKEIQLQIKTEDKLSTIQSEISKVNQNFHDRLIELYPNLTKTEREVCALLRLNLSIKEIMTIRNTSIDAVKSTRYRIRKKMGIQQGEELEKFIQNIN